MDDIVERLEKFAEIDLGDSANRPQFALVSEAIAEIKRLRNELFGLNAKLDSVRSVAGLAISEPLTYANIKKQARNGPDPTPIERDFP